MSKRSTPQNRRLSGVKRKLRGGHEPSIGKTTQFKPGRSGNASGRPKRKPFTDAYLAFLDAHPEELAAIVRAMVKQAKKGNVKAVIEMTDRSEGKAPLDVRLDLGEQLLERIAEGHKRAAASRT